MEEVNYDDDDDDDYGTPIYMQCTQYTYSAVTTTRPRDRSRDDGGSGAAWWGRAERER